MADPTHKPRRVLRLSNRDKGLLMMLGLLLGFSIFAGAVLALLTSLG